MYADVIVDLSLQKLDRVFQYRIPDFLEDAVAVGTQVTVPFGNGKRVLKGYVTGISGEPSIDPSRIKDIIAVPSSAEPIESRLIALASWMCRVYGSTMNQALKTVLPVSGEVGGRKKTHARLIISRDEASGYREVFEKKHQTARLRLLEAVMENEELLFPDDGKKYGITQKTLRELSDMGIVSTYDDTVYRNPFDAAGMSFEERHELSEVQRFIADDIEERLKRGDRRPSLIHGVTGSGKTLVYMELISKALDMGKEAIVLIPEISLTFQTVNRFYSRFGDLVSVIHSRLSAGERYDQIRRVREGKAKVMIGPRSALFTPFENLGVIVIDEEHDGSYKSEAVPRYHARETAIKRARDCGAVVVMGSATPSVDSYSRAADGTYRLYTLDKRANGSAMPTVDIVDMRQELKSGNRSVFSQRLKELIEDRLSKNEQVMLFLNRRGYAGFVSCRACGYVVKCPHCDVSLTLHLSGFLLCHYCGYKRKDISVCPSCGSSYIGGFKAGTETVAQLAQKEFADARILRMDRDSTGHKGGHDRILKAFADRQADILVGTQMIVKGHDFPDVTLVGVIAADLSLHEGDYRASEKTFQLLTQASGRAGRGKSAGHAVIQTYNPENYSITCAASNDYKGFFEREMGYRRLLGYPPAGHMMAVGLTSADDRKLEERTDELKSLLSGLVESSGGSLTVLGPCDANPSKVRDIRRKAAYMKARKLEVLIEAKSYIETCARERGMYNDINILFDTDPVNPF